MGNRTQYFRGGGGWSGRRSARFVRGVGCPTVLLASDAFASTNGAAATFSSSGGGAIPLASRPRANRIFGFPKGGANDRPAFQSVALIRDGGRKFARRSPWVSPPFGSLI